MWHQRCKVSTPNREEVIRNTIGVDPHSGRCIHNPRAHRDPRDNPTQQGISVRDHGELIPEPVHVVLDYVGAMFGSLASLRDGWQTAGHDLEEHKEISSGPIACGCTS